MSGDVQPRKRKDKKRRKDESEQLLTQPTHPPVSTNQPNDDVNIHVHKDGGTGGGICAKLVFFVLLSALVVVIGMIITEYRGLSDVDTVDSESKFAQIFEGWIDTGHRHDDHEIEEAINEHDHEEDEEDASEDDHDDHEPSDEEDDEKEPSEEDEEDDEHDEEDEDPALEDSEEDRPEESEENDLDEEDDENEDASPEKLLYESDEKDEEDDNSQDEDEPEQEIDDHDHAEDEQELQNIESDEDNEEDDDHTSPEQASKEDEEDDDDNGDLKEDPDDSDESDEKASPVPEKILEKRDVEEEAETEERQESGGNVAAKEAEESDSDNEEEDFEHTAITSKEDQKIKGKLDEAQKSAKNNSAYAIKLFDTILQKYPLSPRGVYGKALSLDYLADQKRSNDILQEALQLYLQLFDLPDVPDELFRIAAERCIERMRFVGQYRNAIIVHQKVIKRFPGNPKHSNDLAVTYLTINRVEDARAVLKEVLSKWPNDGFALVHYGFILKTTDNNLKEAVEYLERGLATKAEGVTDGRFYFHLGDALARLDRAEDAMKIYEEGVKNKVFLSKYQRSLYNVPRLTGKPWWDLEDLPYLDLFRSLAQNWEQIRDEGLAVLNSKGHFQDESENLKDTGDWKQFELFARGQKNVNNCKKCPFTCSLIEKVPEAKGCRRGQTKFSVMHPGTHVWPHCGPTNCRLRVHVGLKVPPKTFIRVADTTRSWKDGRVFVFDDSFEHEVWHNGTDFRLVLIVDVWHPELTSMEKRSLSPI